MDQQDRSQPPQGAQPPQGPPAPASPYGSPQGPPAPGSPQGPPAPAPPQQPYGPAAYGPPPPPAPPQPYGPHYGYAWAFPHPAPPDPPELPDGASPWPRWPAWYGPAAFGVGIGVTLVAVTIVGVIAALAGANVEDEATGAFTQIATVMQDAIFIAAAVFFAARTAPPRPWQFGLRGSRFWPAVGWAALGIVAFWIFAAVYVALVSPEGEQGTLENLGTEDSRAALIGAAVLVIVVAPVAEEFFFRGFFYRALRTRMAVLPAALLDGALFGVIHFEGADTAEILPILAVLGVTFCLVYERTGTLFTTIALHALNNFIAYGNGTDEWAVAGIVGATAIAGCMIVPRFLPSPASAR
ncbi:MAG TPA: CPBP family intramembrane glutamic endopeptidase [Thermoleophilaceae bacterium]